MRHETGIERLRKGGQYRLEPSIAYELEVFAKIGDHGSRKNIVEEALEEFFKKNPIKKNYRDAAELLLSGNGG